MNTIFDEFRFNLKHYRELKGWTQSQLAIQANSSNGMIGNIESGKSKPSLDNIIRLADALDIHPADLFLRDASKNADREILSKYSRLISCLETIPTEISASIELMISDLSKKFQN